MLVVGLFNYSTELEQALRLLESNGIDRSKMMAVPMEADSNRQLISGESRELSFDVGFAAATALGVVGISIGFVLSWGPILWGLISTASGFMAGYFITRLISARKKNAHMGRHACLPELVIIVRCEEESLEQVQMIMHHYGAWKLGIMES
ncbi:hypothetical protein [Paenibacillus pinihumi]|uniref:hypothetical protein n=1 Tax=Paenibacillus pinihumi TaxID=669462 RepID=UPI0006849217|nr:hypothetical protein [Paenibacillus pinihumi]